MTKKKVLILGKLPPPFMGPAIATQIILNSTLKDKYDLIHLNTKANESLDTMGKWNIAKLFRNIALYIRLIGLLISHRPALVLIPISQSTMGFVKDFFFIALSRISGRRVLVQLRGSNFTNWLRASSPMLRHFVKWSLKQTQGVIVLGNNLKPIFYDIFEDNRIFVVPNGGNYDLSFSVKRNNPVRILYLGNLQASKGIEDVIQAIAIIHEKGMIPFHVDVVGKWRSDVTRDDCMKLVTDKKLPISFHPPASGETKMNFLSQADIFVFTPRMPEGHPWVIVESMAAGLPIISTDRGAIIESVHDGKNGFIVEAEQPELIADKLKKLLTDQELREKMGKQSRQMYEEYFTEEKMVSNLSDTFEKVMQKN